MVGLGNMGRAYARHRHNVGFMVIEAIAKHYHFPDCRSQFHGLISQNTMGEHSVALVMPATMMNLSGQCVGEMTRFYKIPNASVFVIHDELDLPLGHIRIKRGGGHAGHNGLKSVDAHIGPDYWRIRFGIGHPGDKSLVTQHVLGDFNKNEKGEVGAIIDQMVNHLPLLLTGQHSAWLKSVLIPQNQKEG